MRFEDIKPGMVFREDIGGEYGAKFWFVYKTTPDRLITILFKSNKFAGRRIVKIIVTKDVYENPDYAWRERETVSINDLIRYKKKLIPAIFEEL